MPVLALVLALALALGCYESSKIARLEVSPDGRWAAALNDHGELGVLCLSGQADMLLFSSHAEGGMAWSPDSRRLAFVERAPGQEPALWVLNVETGQRAPRPAMVGPSWKGDPQWLSNETLAFLSDRDADAVGVWLTGVRADGSPDRPFLLLSPPSDVSRLWACPQGPTMAYQAMDGQESALWLWRPGVERPRRIGGPVPEGFGDGRSVSFAADGQAMASLRRAGQGWNVDWREMKDHGTTATLALEAAPTDVLILGDGRVAVSMGTRATIWRPRAGLFERTRKTVDWWRAPARLVDRLGSQGVVAIVDDALLVTADRADDLTSGRLRAWHDEDVIRLAWHQSRMERYGAARRLLDDLWAQAQEGSPTRGLTALARARLERMQGHWSRAERWLDQAEREVVPGARDALLAARLERLAVTFFDDRDRREAAKLASALAASAPSGQSALSTNLGAVVGGLSRSSDARAARAWQAAGADARQGRTARAAKRMARCFEQDAWTTANLRMLAAILEGGLEPMDLAAGQEPRISHDLAAQPDFQQVLLKAMRLSATPAPLAAEARDLLLEQWVVHGDAPLARKLAAQELARDPAQAIATDMDLLRQYLATEERASRVDRVVGDVLLDRDVAARLTSLLADPRDLLTLRLAQARRSILAGDLDGAGASLDAAWQALTTLPGAPSELLRLLAEPAERPPQSQRLDFLLARASFDEAFLGLIHDLYLVKLDQAKIAERRGDWKGALAGYRACLALVDRVPGDWDVAPNELAWRAGLIEQGAADAGRLTAFLDAIDRMGDPLINPTRDPARLGQALAGFQAMERQGAPAWLAPHVVFCQGLCHAQLRQAEAALGDLRRLEAMRPDDGLLQRALLEQSALRDDLGQNWLAARLDERLMALRVPVAARVSAALALVQSEQLAGSKASPAERLERLLPSRSVPPAWGRWLRFQVGAGAGLAKR
jgi:tetratricopeptide (TPR) repeat protein